MERNRYGNKAQGGVGEGPKQFPRKARFWALFFQIHLRALSTSGFVKEETNPNSDSIGKDIERVEGSGKYAVRPEVLTEFGHGAAQKNGRSRPGRSSA